MSAILTNALMALRGPACFDADYGPTTSHQLDPRNDDGEDQWMSADLDGLPVSVCWIDRGGHAVIDGFCVGEWDEEKHFVRADFVAASVFMSWQQKAQRELRELLERAHDEAQQARFAA